MPREPATATWESKLPLGTPRLAILMTTSVLAAFAQRSE